MLHNIGLKNVHKPVLTPLKSIPLDLFTFSAEYAIYCKFYIYLELVHMHGEAVNYRPCGSSSFEVAKPRKITAISAVIAKE